MTRVAPVLLLVAALVAAEETPPPPAPTLSMSARGGMLLSMSPERPSEAKGGWQIRYEEVRLEGDRLAYRLAPYPGSAKAVLLAADLFGAEPDGRVLFDSSASKLPQASFRGTMHPRAVAIRRQDPDPEQPTRVRFRAELEDVGDFHGFMRSPKGDRQYLVWTDRAVLEYVAPLDPGSAAGVGAPQLTVIYLYGRAERDGQAARPAEVIRMGKPVADAEATVERQRGKPEVAMRGGGATPALYFDATSELQTITGLDFFEGDMDDFSGKAQSRPKLK